MRATFFPRHLGLLYLVANPKLDRRWIVLKTQHEIIRQGYKALVDFLLNTDVPTNFGYSQQIIPSNLLNFRQEGKMRKSLSPQTRDKSPFSRLRFCCQVDTLFQRSVLFGILSIAGAFLMHLKY